MKALKDNFSTQAATYAQFRPTYPTAFFDYLLSLVSSKKMAWDVATGNGQVAAALASSFEKIVATDISEAQLDHAATAENIEYRLERSEKSSILSHSVDLITVGQAIHWFDHAVFYDEVRRVARPDALLAVFGYATQVFGEQPLDDLFWKFYSGPMDAFWEPERRFIAEKYESLPFPFLEIEAPHFDIEARWTRRDFEGYLNSWSATQKFIRANGFNPVDGFMKEISPFWPENEVKTAVFPLLLKMARL